MKTGVVAFLGLCCTAVGMENVAGIGRLVNSHFEVIKTVNETMVYYLKRIQDNGSDNDCIVVSEELARYGISKRYPNSEIHIRENVYDIIQNGRTNTFQVCEGGGGPVNLEHDIITLTHNVCQFSALFCDIKSETAFWNVSTNLEVIARGQANIWILSRQPWVMLLVFEDNNGIFILQLLRKIKNDKNEEVWITNVNGLQAKEIPDSSTADKFSHLGQYLTHSDFLNIGNTEDGDTKSNTDTKSDGEDRSEGEIQSGAESERNGDAASESESRASRLLSLEQMVFYTFILVVISVAFYFLERIFGLIINCIILSRTRNQGCSALCFKPLSQNMMNDHLYKYYTDEVTISKTAYGLHGINGDCRNGSLNVYDRVHSDYMNTVNY